MDGQIDGREICDRLTSCRQSILYLPLCLEKARVDDKGSEKIVFSLADVENPNINRDPRKLQLHSQKSHRRR